MIGWINQFLTPPVFEDDMEKTRLAQLLQRVILASVTLAAALCLGLLLTNTEGLDLLAPALWLLLGLAALWLLRRGWVNFVRTSFILLNWVLLVLATALSGDISSPAFPSLVLVAVMAGLLCGPHAGFIFTGLSLAAGLGILYAKFHGLLPDPPLLEVTPVRTVALLSTMFGAMVMLVYLATHGLHQALNRARQSETTLRKVLSALQHSESNFRALADNAYDGLVIVSAEGGLNVYANQRFSEFTGYSLVELNRLSIKALVHPDEYEGVIRRYRRRLAGEQVVNQYETVLVHKDGRNLPVEIAAARTVWHDRPAVIVIFRDISQRKESEAVLQRTEKRYRELFEEAPAMYVITRSQDGAPFVTDCNNLFLETLNYTRAEVIGRPLADFYTPVSRAEMLAGGGYQRALTDHFQVEERQLLTRDGQVIETLLRARPEIESDGRVMGTRAMFVDVTAQKQVEAELVQHRLHLEALVAERTNELSRANEQLQWSEERFRRTFDESPIGAAMVSLDYRFLRVNRQLCRITGYTEPELLALSFPDITHPDDLALDTDQARRLGLGEIDQYAMDKRYIRKDGQPVWVHLSARLIRDAAGQPLYFLPMVEDITARKQSEEQTRYLASLVENVSDAVFSIENRDTIRSWNRAAELMYGWSEEEVLGQSVSQVFQAGFLQTEYLEQSQEQIWAAVQEQGYWQGELTRLRKDGTKLYALTSVTLLRDGDGRPTGAVVIDQDITGRKRMEQAVRESQARLKAIFDNAAAMMIVTEPGGYFAQINQYTADTLGYSVDELLQMGPPDITHPDDIEESHRVIGQIFRGEVDLYRTEKRYRRRDGSFIWGALSISSIHDEGGRVIAAVGVVIDISERKLMEQKLLESQTLLLEAGRLANLGTWEWNVSDRTWTLSEQALRIHGGQNPHPTTAELKALLHPGDTPAMERKFRDSLHEIKPYNIEYRTTPQADGTSRVIQAYGEVLQDAAGNPLKFIGTVQDITERKQAEEALQQRNQELTLLNRVGHAFNSSLDLDQVLLQVLQEMQELMQITAASFWLVTPDTGELVCRQAVGPGNDAVRGWRLQPGQGIAGRAAQSGQSLLVADSHADKRHFRGVDRQINLELRSILSIPLKAKEEVIGVLNLVDTTAGRFTPADLTMLEPLVASAAIAIENARLHAAVQTELAVRQQAEAALRRLNEELEQRVEERTLALRRSEQMFRDLAENIREVFWVREGERMLYVSPAYEEVWGRSRDSLYQDGSAFFDSVAPEDWEQVTRALRAELDQQRMFDEQYRVMRPDGSQRWVWARSFPVQKDDGAVQLVGIAEDITERKQMEERLATIYRLGQELTLLQDEAAIIRQVLDMAGRILHINYVGCGLIDSLSGDLVYSYQCGPETNIEEKRIPLSDEAPWLAQLTIQRREVIYRPDVTLEPGHSSMVSQVPVRAELYVPMRVGDWNIGVLHAGSASPNYFSPADQQLLQTLAGQTAVALENARLYTRLRQNLGELTRLNAENSRLFQAERSRYREAEALRRAALALTATMDQAELLNRILTELQVVIPYDSAAVFVLKDDHLEIVGGRGFADLSTVIGARIPLQAEFSPDYQVITSLQPVIIPDTSASPLALAHLTPGTALIRSWLAVPLVAQDRPMGMITLDKHQPNFYNETHAQTAQAYAAQAAIALENARLYHDLQHQIQAVQAAQARLIQSERMAALGRLMASIAHEINNPLQGVQGFLSLLGEELEDRHRPDKINAYLKIADQEIERIAGIVHRMREFYRPLSYQAAQNSESFDGFYHLKAEELQAVDVHLILESVLQLANKNLQHNGVEVERQWARKLPLVQGSPDHLKQVFLNLALNALDAMPAGGGRLRIRTARGRMPLSTDRSEQAVRIEFSDTGAGMPPEVLGHIFEPMFSTKDHGSGFGLFTTYQIITAHHGHISAASQEGKGTTFTIFLPVTQSADKNSQE